MKLLSSLLSKQVPLSIVDSGLDAIDTQEKSYMTQGNESEELPNIRWRWMTSTSQFREKAELWDG
jgi:hypothetical protein